MFKKGFTLAEVMITLTVIGIITAVILPVAFHSSPDKNVMKFKKAHNILYQVISELINSDKYYLDGDLGKTADGRNIDYKVDTNYATYLCNTIADVVSSQKVNCSSYFEKNINAYYCSDFTHFGPVHMDKQCKIYSVATKEEIVLSDGVVIYQTIPGFTFGYSGWSGMDDSEGEVFYLHEGRSKGENYRCSKILCIDIDGIPSGGSGNCDDKTDICPFGYGIRVDGKITIGPRAAEWLEKSIQNEN